MVALRQQFRVEHARADAAPRKRSASVVELAGRHEFKRPAYERRMTFEPKVDPLHWVIGLAIAGSFLGAIFALMAG
jgi:hypothetical protein